MLELRSVQFFYRSIECVTVDMDYSLRKIPRQLQLRNILIRSTKIGTEVDSLQLPLLCQDLLNLLSEVFVFVFFIIEIFRAFRGIVYYF